MVEWTTCDTCGGALPMVEGDNDHRALRAVGGGECPGMRSPQGICGAYAGWSRGEIAEAVREVEED